jgi:hypothetical protein
MAIYCDDDFEEHECEIKERNGSLVYIKDENGNEKYVYDFNVEE